MAIALDTSTDGGLVNPATSITYAHTCTGSNLILFVSAFGDVTNDVVTGATYNGVSMSLVGKALPTGAADRWVYLWVLVNPATGTHNVVVSASASIAIDSDAVSYTGAKQSGQPDASNTGANNQNSITISVTTVADNCWLVGGFRASTTGATPGTGTTQRQGSSGLYTADSNGAKTPAGSYSLIYNNGNSNFAGVVASIAPATGTTTTYRRLALLGAGV